MLALYVAVKICWICLKLDFLHFHSQVLVDRFRAKNPGKEKIMFWFKIPVQQTRNGKIVQTTKSAEKFPCYISVEVVSISGLSLANMTSKMPAFYSGDRAVNWCWAYTI